MSDLFPAAPSPHVPPPRRAAAWRWLPRTAIYTAIYTAIFTAVCTAFAPIAHGQPPSPPSGRPADPADPSATVPAVVYRSPLPAAPRATPVDAGSWRDANHTAARIGGWRAYLREAQTPETSPTPLPSTMPPPVPPPLHKH